MTLKLKKIGNSLGIILPKELLLKMNLKEGDTLNVISMEEGMKLTPYNPNLLKQMELAKSIMSDHRDVLKALSN